MLPLLEAVPNFSEGRDLGWVRELVRVISGEGADVLDWTADPDHHRSVVTYIGAPATVERASLAAARFAIEGIDLRRHSGVHPRIGALDVLPFVPMGGLGMDVAVGSARRVARLLAEEGVPVYLYGRAADGGGRRLAPLRRGGFEALQGGFPPGREPDLPAPAVPGSPHPTAGTTCVGAREVLLAWNVFVEGVDLEELKAVAAGLRETGGGFDHLRVLALALPESGRLQISMNLEDPLTTSPYDVFDAIEARVEALGGSVAGTEVIGMIPDPLVFPAAADRLKLLCPDHSRLLSRRVAEHMARWSAAGPGSEHSSMSAR